MGQPDLHRDRELVERAQKDPLAFGAIFDLYYKQILTYALRRTGDAATAEDIAAETFAKAMRGLWRYTWKGIPLSAWLYRIAGNELRMLGRKRSTVSLDLLLEAGFDRADETLAAERDTLDAMLQQDAQFARVSAALRKLPPKHQEVIALRYMEGKSNAEVAAIVGKREGTVRSLLSRGLTMLREDLTQQSAGGSITRDEGRNGLQALTQNIS